VKQYFCEGVMRPLGERYLRMRYFSRVFILFSILSLLPAAAMDAKSNGRLAGNVRSMSGSPLRDVIVKIFREMHTGEIVRTLRSDSRGAFTTAQLSPGTYFLEISRQGYQPLTTGKFAVGEGQTTSIDVILQEFIDYLSKDDDPRNWDLKTVMRSTSDRRLIFRNTSGDPSFGNEIKESPFSRGGTMNIASGKPFGGDSYIAQPRTSQNGVSSNFAFTEPVNQHSRMILSGQLDFGYSAFWRVRNTYDYRPDSGHDYRVSVGYGRMNGNYSGSNLFSSQLLSQESGLRDSGVQTLAFGLEGTTKLLDILAIKYGFDYSQLYYGDNSRSFIYPSIQILIAPSKGWNIHASFTSHRMSDTNAVILPDGEVLDLSEPTLITMIENRVTMSEIRHSEIAAERSLTPRTSIEFAVYQDHTQGPGLPIMVTTITPLENQSRLLQMNEDHFKQQGARVTFKRQIMDSVTGSLDYVYGAATSISGMSELASSDCLTSDLANYMKQNYQHAITGRLNATLPITKTNLLASMRWYSGNPLTPVDWFSDHMNIGTKSANIEIRQAIPFPDLMGTTGHWEVWLNLRNVFNQGRESLPATDGELVLNRNPRSLRFGLSFNFR
jgi:hypothetical protein